jgi:hypothetical protein
MTTIINGSSPSITFSDNTTQTTALPAPGTAGNVLVSSGTAWTSGTGSRSGITTVTLSSGSPSATLTAASNQYVRVVLNTTTPYAPSIVMPDMTTLVTGQGYFVISNETGLALAIKDSGGTIREILPSSGKYTLTITSIASSTGVWYFNNSPILIPIGEQGTVYIPRSSYLTNTTRNHNGFFCKLDSTNFAYVFNENDASGTYAKLFTVNTSTGAFTAGNRVTVSASFTNPLAWDTDNAGHALVVCSRSGTQSVQYLDSFGLSVSGGTLYASAVNTLDLTNQNSVGSAWVAYLGSNSAYSYGTIYNNIGCCGGSGTAARGATVTGTTTVTYTQSANNATFSGGGGPVRTSLTTFIASNQFLSYTPASNTFTRGTRTTQTQMELAGVSGAVSFGQSGFAYCSGKVMQGGIVFDITNAGAAGVTAVFSASYQMKPQISTNYNVVSTNIMNFRNFTSFLNASNQMYSTGYQGRLIQTDPTSSTMNVSISGSQNSIETGLVNDSIMSETAYPPSNSSYPTLIMSGSFAVSVNTTTAYSNGGYKEMFLQLLPIATSIV